MTVAHAVTSDAGPGQRAPGAAWLVGEPEVPFPGPGAAGRWVPGPPELLGHRDVSTTMIYTHVLDCGPSGVRSPMDRLGGGG